LITEDVCLVVRSSRRPPIETLRHYAIPKGFACIIVADPSVFEEHRQFYKSNKQIDVWRGVIGLSAQAAECYRAADAFGFPWYLRLDDDLQGNYFVRKDKTFPKLKEVITKTFRAQRELDVSLVGFAKTTNRFWMKDGWGRAFGLAHGAALLLCSTNAPKQFMDPALPLYDDVWQSCSHRADKGAIGRIREIGLHVTDLGQAQTVTKGLDKLHKHYASRDRILKRWSDFVSCDGKAFVDRNGRIGLPWRFHRHANFSARST
jgi:hypothetical protein